VRTSIFVVAILSVAFAVYAASDEQTLVVCAPGSPGSTDEAQPRMDALASALGSKVGGSGIAAVYEPTNAGGVKRFQSASLGIVSLPFFLTHEKELGLHARLTAVQKGRPALEHWTLVAQKGRVTKAESLAGMTIMSSAGFAPEFVRGAVAQLGTVPADVKITSTVAVLSALRKAAKGDPIAVLLDGAQASSLASLPFAAQLETVATSPAWPMGMVVTVDSRAKNWPALQSAFLGLANDKAGAAVLEGMQMEHFVPLDDASLTSARKAFAGAQ
jgi:hypothetical protein